MASNNAKCLSAAISVANLLILILAIIIMCLSLGYWNDYTSCAFTIIIALSWACCICVENNVYLSIYSVLMVIDMLILLANAIYYTIRTKQYNDFCYDLYTHDGPSPQWGCHDWRLTGKPRTIGIFVSFYIAFVFRLFNIIGSCLLAKTLYQS